MMHTTTPFPHHVRSSSCFTLMNNNNNHSSDNGSTVSVPATTRTTEYTKYASPSSISLMQAMKIGSKKSYRPVSSQKAPRRRHSHEIFLDVAPLVMDEPCLQPAVTDPPPLSQLMMCTLAMRPQIDNINNIWASQEAGYVECDPSSHSETRDNVTTADMENLDDDCCWLHTPPPTVVSSAPPRLGPAHRVYVDSPPSPIPPSLLLPDDL